MPVHLCHDHCSDLAQKQSHAQRGVNSTEWLADAWVSAMDDQQMIRLQHNSHAICAIVEDDRMRGEMDSTHLYSVPKCLCLIMSRLAYASIHDKDDEVWLCLGGHLHP